MKKLNRVVVATYSKRKKFRRIIRDNWADLHDDSKENVFDIQGPLSSTPIVLKQKAKSPFVLQPTCLNDEFNRSVQITEDDLSGSLFSSDFSSQICQEKQRNPNMDDHHYKISIANDVKDSGAEKINHEVEAIVIAVSNNSVYNSNVGMETDDVSLVSHQMREINDFSNHVKNLSMAEVSVETSPEANKYPASNASSLEMSIRECMKDNMILPIGRELLLDEDLPSLTKLLSQCRRVSSVDKVFECEGNNITKIGEGCFGEVFRGRDIVYKVIPVGGNVEINGFQQTSFENAFQEIAVSRSLSDLAGDQVQMGKAFCQLTDVVFTQGSYPNILLEAWDKFQNTENERPDIFDESQCYVIMLSKYSGVQLEDYFNENKLTPDQVHSIIRQITCSLAAAEQKCQFEHRDLHWGNVLIMETDTKLVEFTQDGKTYVLRSHGVLATVIDFTFSRIDTCGCLNFVDLEEEPALFEGDVKQDIQYKVYRDMRAACRKNWAKFSPRTNVLWILYLFDKLSSKSRSLKQLRTAISSCKSASKALPIVFRSL